MRVGLDHIVRGLSYQCITFDTDETANEKLHYVLAKVQKGELNIRQQTSYAAIEACIGQIGPSPNIHLVFNNQQVIHKSSTRINAPKEAIVQQLFPSLDTSSFYYEICHTKTTTYASVCRKSYIDEIIEILRCENFFITQWSIGPYSIQQLLPFLSVQDAIYIPGIELVLKDQELAGVNHITHNTVKTHYNLENMQIPNQYLLSFSGILRSFISFDYSEVSNGLSKRKAYKKTAHQHRFFKLGLPWAVGILLLVFSINFMFYNHYFGEVQRLQEVSMVNELQRKKVMLKDSIVRVKEKRFEDVIKSSSSSSSFYTDTILKNMPATILLDKISYQPLLRKKRPHKPLEIYANHINVWGNTAENEDLSQWVSSIERLAFVNDVGIKIGEVQKGITAFELQITLHP